MKRSLGEVIEAVKDGEVLSSEELTYALLALEVSWAFLNMDLRALADSSRKNNPMLVLGQALKRNKRILSAVPKVWLGTNVPSNPEYQDRRRLATRILDKFLGPKDAD